MSVIESEEDIVRSRLDRFKADLILKENVEIVNGHILHGDTFALDETLYYSLKSEIASFFKLHPNEVVMVGSGKLGFTLVDKSVERPRYSSFGNTSDIDIAIVSKDLFDDIWNRLFIYHQNAVAIPDAKFLQYFFRGWLRPDKLPKSMRIKSEWFEFFRQLVVSDRFGPYKITGGLYRDWSFLESYQIKSVELCRGMVK